MLGKRKKEKKGASKDTAPGPDPERLKIDGDWKDAVKKALETPPPCESDDDQEEQRENDVKNSS